MAPGSQPPMKQYQLVYDPEDDTERLIFNNIDFNKLTGAVTIRREEALPEEELELGRKKSEVVEYQNEEYATLMEAEQHPYVITDNESRAYSGKLQHVTETGSKYFALINMGNYLKMIPITRWYGFTQRNHFADGNVEALEKNLGNNFEYFGEDEDSESKPEIDYEDEFDDDDGDAQVTGEAKEKKLTTSGKELLGLVENYEHEGEESTKPSEAMEGEDDEDSMTKKAKNKPTLTKEELKRRLGKKKLSIREFLKSVKQDFDIEEPEKAMIREFIHESCAFEIDSATNEKIFKLKK